MRLALAQAEIAYANAEAPVGAVVVYKREVIATGYNEREARQDPVAHAELLAMVRAASWLGSWRLDDCALYVTLEPCAMCAGAVVQARLPVLVFGAYDPKAGACGSLYRITEDARLNHRASTTGGVLAEECGGILTRFFAEQRAKGKK
jgi:tRNA(adenine34) deaminase